MECHEGATMIKTFRGLMADGAQDTIVLHTNDGSTGYRIKKLQAISNDPGIADREHIIKIYKVEQTTVDGLVDFSDQRLLGTVFVTNRSDTLLTGMNIIFDQEIFNQDIYITHFEARSSGSCNYYIELEQVKLDLSENTVATLKDIRNIARKA